VQLELRQLTVPPPDPEQDYVGDDDEQESQVVPSRPGLTGLNFTQVFDARKQRGAEKDEQADDDQRLEQ
jgi:hypothetical protein